MPSVAVLGATGNLGRHVVRQVQEQGWPLSVAVRDRSRLAPEVAAQAQVSEFDIANAPLADIASFARGHDVLVCCAGLVTAGDGFVQLFDRVVTAIESLPNDERPVCWFLAGAGVLPLDARGRLGVDLPKIRDTYWPHKKNFERLQRSDIDWRLLCPGPMVDQPAIGLQRFRVTRDALPAPLPVIAAALAAPLVLPMFALKIPEMIIPYADAAAFMLANSQRGDANSHHRIGLALPAGMKGHKDQWAARSA